MTIDNHQLINQDSGNVEYYTPSLIIESARWVMGGIDLDPSSCEVANGRVRARRYFGVEHDGLSQDWDGNVWMNHPFSRKGNKLWIQKAVYEYEKGNVEQLCCICFASTSEGWFQPLFRYPQCFLSPRTNYENASGKIVRGVSKGSVVTYMGANAERFKKGFGPLGFIK